MGGLHPGLSVDGCPCRRLLFLPISVGVQLTLTTYTGGDGLLSYITTILISLLVVAVAIIVFLVCYHCRPMRTITGALGLLTYLITYLLTYLPGGPNDVSHVVTRGVQLAKMTSVRFFGRFYISLLA